MSAKGLSQNNIAETIIGALVVAVAIGFMAFTYMRTGSGSLSGYEVNAHLAKVDGLGVGTDVRISGIKVGSVSGCAYDAQVLPSKEVNASADGRHGFLCCHDAAVTLEFELSRGRITRQFDTAAGCEFILSY